MWVGGNDFIAEGEWSWTDDTPFTYTKWHSGKIL